jgi:hypothetical protein
MPAAKITRIDPWAVWSFRHLQLPSFKENRHESVPDVGARYRRPNRSSNENWLDSGFRENTHHAASTGVRRHRNVCRLTQLQRT